MAAGSNVRLPTHRPRFGERRLHDHIHPIGAMGGAWHYLVGTAHTPGRPIEWRTLFSFSRAEHSPLRWYSGVRCRPRLDRRHLVTATGRRPRVDHPLYVARRLFLVLLLPRACLVAWGSSFAQPGIRLRGLPGQPHLVRG